MGEEPIDMKKITETEQAYVLDKQVSLVRGELTFKPNLNLSQKKEVINIIREFFQTYFIKVFQDFLDCTEGLDSYQFNVLLHGRVGENQVAKLTENIKEYVVNYFYHVDVYSIASHTFISHVDFPRA